MTTKQAKKFANVACYCDAAVKRGIVTKEGDNKGRVFLTCNLLQYDDATKSNYGGCTFFHFEDEPMRRCDLCQHLKIKTKNGGDFCVNCVNTYDTSAYLDAIQDWGYLLELLQVNDREALKVYPVPGTTMISLVNKNEGNVDLCKVAIQFQAEGPIGNPTVVTEAKIVFASVLGKLEQSALNKKLLVKN